MDLRWLVSEILLKSLVVGAIYSFGPFYCGVSSSVAFLEFWMLYRGSYLWPYFFFKKGFWV